MMLIHRCAKCTHPEHEHGKHGRRCGLGCPCTSPRYGEPELAPTFNARGEHVDRIRKPGEDILSQTGGVVIAVCACDACQAAYERQAS